MRSGIARNPRRTASRVVESDGHLAGDSSPPLALPMGSQTCRKRPRSEICKMRTKRSWDPACMVVKDDLRNQPRTHLTKRCTTMRQIARVNAVVMQRRLRRYGICARRFDCTQARRRLRYNHPRILNLTLGVEHEHSRDGRGGGGHSVWVC